jgi:tetratricopeptide (TPR) repeat protein
VVEHAISAPDRPLKETQIAIAVFDRRADFDPLIDPIVRVEAGRLRLRLTEYFAGPGQNDKTFIEIAKGGYLPSFRRQHRRRGKIDASGAAYRLYLKGRYFWDKRSAESIAKAAEYYRQALGVDPGFTLGYVGIADCNLILATFEFATPEPLIAKARAAAESALKQGALLAEAHTTLGCIKAFYDHQWREAEASFQLAIEIDPDYPVARQWLGMCHCACGQLDEGLTALRAGAERDALSLMVNTQLGCGLYIARRYAEAEETCNLVLEMDPNFWPARYFRGLTYEQEGLFAQAVRDLHQAIELSGGNSLPLAALVHVHARAGGRRDALRIIRQLQLEDSRFISPWALALAHAGLGDTERAISLLGQGVAARSPYTAIFLSTDPRLDWLRSDPRFREIEAKLYRAAVAR